MASEGRAEEEVVVGRAYHQPQRCTWSAHGCPQPDPHRHEPVNKGEKKVLDNILDQIGNTPLVRLNRIPQSMGIECDVYGKCEFFNAGGSVKDRIGKRMLDDAEKDGSVKPGDVLIEPTSGNTGIGLALAAAVKGYRMIITLPQKMSVEKVRVLKALGAEIVRTPTEAASFTPESHIGMAERLQREIPNSHILDQYNNPANPLAHYDGTAEEILWQLDGQVDMVVVGTGTGGTMTGIARKMKEKLGERCVVVGVDPYGSILALPESINGGVTGPYLVEGTGYDFLPRVLDRGSVDTWVKTTDKDSFLMARRLIREEGLLCGGSSGANLWAAMQVAKGLKKGQRCVVILPDSVRNYMTKFLADEWMAEHGFMEPDVPSTVAEERARWGNATVADLKLRAPVTVTPSTSIADAVAVMEEHAFDNLPVCRDRNKTVGLVTLGGLVEKLASKKAAASDAVETAMFRWRVGKTYTVITRDTPLHELTHYFDKHSVALITEAGSRALVGVCTKIDLLRYLVQHQGQF